MSFSALEVHSPSRHPHSFAPTELDATMSAQNIPIFELEGDVPPPPIHELPGDIFTPELPGDGSHLEPANYDLLPLPTPLLFAGSSVSHASALPRPLNFSRPLRTTALDDSGASTPSSPRKAYAPSEYSIDEAIPTPFRDIAGSHTGAPKIRNISDYGFDVAETPPVPARAAARLSKTEKAFEPFEHSFSAAIPHDESDTETDEGKVYEPSQYSIDEAIPPPIRTHANLDHLNLETLSVRDSFDEAIPPPIRTNGRGASAESVSYNIEQRYVAPPPVKESQQGPKTWIYRPYMSQSGGSSVNRSSIDRSSVASSAGTAETDESYDSFDADSILGSDTTGCSAATWHSDTSRHSQTSRHTEASRDGAVTARSSVSDFAFDGQMGIQPRERSSLAVSQNQRWSGPPRPPFANRDGNARNDSNTSSTQPRSTQFGSLDSSNIGSNASSGQPLLKTTTTQSSQASIPSITRPMNKVTKAPPVPEMKPRIVKRTSVDQMSEHVNPWQGESISDRGSVSSNEWTSSDHDTSVLSVEKIHKLKKKGINPALYLEMKNARKGKSKWVNPLGGSSFLM